MSQSHAQKIVLASGNAGKIKEIQAILPHCHILPQHQFNVKEIAETGSTFIENAIIKARNASLQSQLPALADDSGLVVDALNGAPGIISARYAGEQATDQENLEKVLCELKSIPNEQRGARFICVLVLMRHANDPFPLIAQGSWEGSILNESRGTNGFGYDPIFWVPSENCSSAELSSEKKNKISHRGLALQQLRQYLSSD